MAKPVGANLYRLDDAPRPSPATATAFNILFCRYEPLVNPLDREAAKQNKRVARKTTRRSQEGVTQ